jgi:hypothetical protein
LLLLLPLPLPLLLLLLLLLPLPLPLLLGNPRLQPWASCTTKRGFQRHPSETRCKDIVTNS